MILEQWGKVKVIIVSCRQLLIPIEKKDVKSLKFSSLCGIKTSLLTRVILSSCNFKIALVCKRVPTPHAVCNLFLISCYSNRWQLSQYFFCFPKTSFCVSQLIFFKGEWMYSLSCIYWKDLWKIQPYKDVIDLTLLCLPDMQCNLISSQRMFLCLLLIFYLSLIFTLLFSTLTWFVSSFSTFPSHFLSSFGPL